LLVFMAFFQLCVMYGQERTVTGQVTASDGMSLPGVNVIVKGTNQGTVTDMDGNFSISVNQDATLVFSSLGFANREALVGTQSVINISLVEDMEGLDEVVVTALGITRERKSLG